MRYARGERAWGRCTRCGDRVLNVELMSDGRIPGLLVCQSCYDIKPPQEQPFRTDEGIILKKPSPDIDDDSPGDSGTTLTDAMGWTQMMGGPA